MKSLLKTIFLVQCVQLKTLPTYKYKFYLSAKTESELFIFVLHSFILCMTL